jgi:DNA-binding transcriptional regulator GbsR (MarR family)
MASFRNRTKVVYFRVSDAEFQQFKDLCRHRGARNMSDLVRSAIQMMARQSENSFELNVTERLRQLENSIEKLSRAVEHGNPEQQA